MSSTQKSRGLAIKALFPRGGIQNNALLWRTTAVIRDMVASLDEWLGDRERKPPRTDG